MRIQLKVQGVLDIQPDNAMSLIIVTDIQEKRQIALPVDMNLRMDFAIRRGKYVGDADKRREVAQALQMALPETLSAIIKYMTDLELCVVIVGVIKGEYRAIIEDQRTGTSFTIRATDGVLLTYADTHIPLYIDDALWKIQSTEYNGEQSKGIMLPLNTLSPMMLKSALRKCVDEEEYEMAEQLKKELNRRGIESSIMNEDEDYEDDLE